MKNRTKVTLSSGLIVILVGIILAINYGLTSAIIPLAIGSSLCLLSFYKGKIYHLIFGHTCLIVGSYLIVWGVYLLPVSQPTISHILLKPLFWGLISVFGGICANYHGFCNCVRHHA